MKGGEVSSKLWPAWGRNTAARWLPVGEDDDGVRIAELSKSRVLYPWQNGCKTTPLQRANQGVMRSDQATAKQAPLSGIFSIFNKSQNLFSVREK
jgi:hypothetical protein